MRAAASGSSDSNERIKMYFLIDFENVQSEGLRGADFLEENDCVTIFYSAATHNCENRYLEEIEQSGCTFDTCKLVQTRKNGLDFYIATRVGEFYGSGHTDRVAIISKDKGFQAVCDYWNSRLPSNKRIVLSQSIERSLMSSNEHSNRVKQIRNKLNNVDIEVFQARYEERRHMREMLKQLFGDTSFMDRVGEIQDLLETGNNKKVIYLNSLHRFGRKEGLEIYDRLKPMLCQNAQ